jgi:hypothetical protein
MDDPMNQGAVMADESGLEERIRSLETAQATEAATQAGAEATQAAAQGGLASTMTAMNAGNVMMMATGSVGLVVGIFLGLAIAKSR